MNHRGLFAAPLVASLLCSCCFSAPAEIRFRDITSDAGLVPPLRGIMGHGAAWGDFDSDGFIDLFVGGFADRPNAEYTPATAPPPDRLLRNRNGARFEAVLNPALETFARTSGAVFADLDNDGTLELYVANNAKETSSPGADEPQRSAKTKRSQLFRQRGGTFTDISRESGACPETLLTARNIGVFDYNADGLLDLFVVEDKFTRNPCSVLFKNEGDLRFRDVTRDVGLPDDIFGLGLAVADLNGDLRPDLFVGHCNRLFLSEPGNKFREATELRPLFAHAARDSEDWPCGAAFGDLNRDGNLDLVVTAHSKQARNRVFLNTTKQQRGAPVTFREVTQECGLGEIVPAKCPHVEIQDFDNDGWPDLYLSAGWLDDSGSFTPLIFRNSSRSNNVPHFAAPRAIAPPMSYFPAGPSGDFNNDGKIDLFLVNWYRDNHSRLLRNESAAGNWLQVQLTGTKMNRMGIGAKVRTYVGDRLIGFQEVSTGYGYASGQPAICHFGLGAEPEVRVEVQWQDGSRTTRRGAKANQRINLREP